MTEEEFKNLKVGDVVSISKTFETITEVYNKYKEVRSITTFENGTKGMDGHLSYGFYKEAELLPLYNSPLYLAMNEGESDD